VPALFFPSDDFALAHFDGIALDEHEDPRLKVRPCPGRGWISPRNSSWRCRRSPV